MKRSIIAVMVALLMLCGCAAEDPELVKEPEPLVIHNKDITEREDIKKVISNRVQDILNGNISVTVYTDGAEDFNYKGTVECVNDGSDGREVILIIHAEHRTNMDDVF